MTLDQELRAVLTERAEAWQPPAPDFNAFMAGGRARQRRHRRVVLTRSAVAVAVAGTLAVGVVVGRGLDTRSAPDPADRPVPTEVTVSPSCIPPGVTPAVPDSPWAGDGFLFDQPVPTTTTPGGRSCRLVLRYGFHRFGAGTSGMAWLYSDGRLIIDLYNYGATPFVQWEHRLTPAGVERIREAVVTMLDKPVSRPSREAEAVIHYGDGIVYPKDSAALVDLLLDQSWLPEEYRVTESPSIYRAPWYLTCYEVDGRHGDDVEAAVRDLPTGARDVLESRVWTALPPDEARGMTQSQCVVLSRADATVLVEALGGDIAVGTAIAFWRGSDGPASQFSVHALMPDGTSGAHGD